MQQVRGPRAFTVGVGGVTKNGLVKLSGVTVVTNTSDAADRPIGVALSNADEGVAVSVRSFSAEGTMEMIAAGAIAAGDQVYAADDGRIQANPGAGTYRLIGIALAGASGAGSEIEILPLGFETVTIT